MSKALKVIWNIVKGIGNFLGYIFLGLASICLNGKPALLLKGALQRVEDIKYKVIQSGLTGDPIDIDLELYDQVPGLIEKLVIKAPVVKVQPLGYAKGMVKDGNTGATIYEGRERVEILLAGGKNE